MKTFAKIILILGIIVAVAMVVFKFEEIARVVSLLPGIPVWVLLLAIIFQFFTYFFQGLTFKLLLKLYNKKGNIIELTNAGVAYTFINQMLPAAGITAAPLFMHLKKGSMNKGESTVVAVLWYVLFYSTFFLALFIGFVGLFFEHSYKKGQATPVIIATVVIFLFIIIGYVIVRKKERLNYFLHIIFSRIISKIPFIKNKAEGFLKKVVVFVDELYVASSVLKTNKKHLLLPVLCTFMNHVMDLLTIYVLLYGYGVVSPIPVLVVGFCLANLITMVSAVPLGIGVFEASMAITYASLGISFEPALVAIIVYRAMAFWAILPIGAFSYHHFLHNWGFVNTSKE